MSNEMNDLIAEGRRWANGHPNRRSGELMRALADALEARQPSGDDREALRIAVGRVVRDVMNFPQAVQVRLLGQDMSPLRDALVDSVVEAGFSRAAAPDAAIEELANARAGWDSALRIVNESNDIIKQLGAERDAALAAIERIRVIHERDMALRDYCSECSDFGSDQFPPGQMVEWPCSTVAALDGAPEPEVKP